MPPTLSRAVGTSLLPEGGLEEKPSFGSGFFRAPSPLKDERKGRSFQNIIGVKTQGEASF